jgi:hypothetical protein
MTAPLCQEGTIHGAAPQSAIVQPQLREHQRFMFRLASSRDRVLIQRHSIIGIEAGTEVIHDSSNENLELRKIFGRFLRYGPAII